MAGMACEGSLVLTRMSILISYSPTQSSLSHGRSTIRSALNVCVPVVQASVETLHLFGRALDECAVSKMQTERNVSGNRRTLTCVWKCRMRSRIWNTQHV